MMIFVFRRAPCTELQSKSNGLVSSRANLAMESYCLREGSWRASPKDSAVTRYSATISARREESLQGLNQRLPPTKYVRSQCALGGPLTMLVLGRLITFGLQLRT